MRDELAVETIENSFQIGRNHPMIQQCPVCLLPKPITTGVVKVQAVRTE